MGGVEVLELVDQEVAAAALRGAAGVGVPERGSRSPGRSARRSRRRPPRPALPVVVESARPGPRASGICSSTGAGEVRPSRTADRRVDVGEDGVGVRLAPDVEDLWTRSRTAGSSRTRSRPWPPNSLQIHKPTLLSVRMWGPPGATSPPDRSFSSSAAFGCRPARSPWTAPPRGPEIRWRRRSVRTLVLPEPAGAMTRAPPVAWLTAASWSGARSAPAAGEPTAESDPASVFQRWTIPTPLGRGEGANGPPST